MVGRIYSFLRLAGLVLRSELKTRILPPLQENNEELKTNTQTHTHTFKLSLSPFFIFLEVFGKSK